MVWLKACWRTDPLIAAALAAQKADVVVAVVGITSKLEGEEMKVNVPGFEGGDRTSLDLPAEEEDLLEALKATGKPLVVVLMNGSALAVNWANDHANAILDAWYSGEEGGTAIAQTLAGVKQSCRTSAGDLLQRRRAAASLRGLRHEEPHLSLLRRQAALSVSGYGLSYTKFEYSGMKLSSPQSTGWESAGC